MVRNTTYAYSKPNARHCQLSIKLLNRKWGGILRQGRYHIAPKNQLHENQPYFESRKETHTNYDKRRKNHRVGRNRRVIKIENIKCTTGRRKDTRSAAAKHAFI